MATNQFVLLGKKNFLPLFITQFFGAFNDNVFKNALAIYITYTLVIDSTDYAEMLVTISTGIFVLPYILFSAPAGYLADKFEKSKLIRFIKLAEIIIALMAISALYLKSIFLLFTVLFLLGTQSTFFGPLKYSILPQHLKVNELIGANALINAATYIAILIGSIVGTILITTKHGVTITSSILFLVSLLGYVSSCYIPKAPSKTKNLKISFNIYQSTLKMLGQSYKKQEIWLCILGLSWGWLAGSTIVTQIPNLTKNILYGDKTVVTFFILLFTIGITLGSIFCNRLLKGAVHATFVPLGALGMSIFLFDIYFASTKESILFLEQGNYLNLVYFLVSFNNIRISIDFLLVAFCAGLYIVPLYAILQARSKEEFRSRNIASNNIVNSIFMIASSLTCALLIYIGFSIPGLILTLSILNLAVAVYICKLVPGSLYRSILQIIMTRMFKVKVVGVDNFYKAGSRVLIVANHTSFLDGFLMTAFLPEKVSFAITNYYLSKWWVKPIKLAVKTFPVDRTNPMVLKQIVNHIKEKNPTVIFPEGRLTATGSLMKIYEGPGLIADKARAKILPVNIEGAQYSVFSRLSNIFELKWFPQITITIRPPCEFHIPSDLPARTRRNYIGNKLYDIMTQMLFESTNYKKTLFKSLIDAKNFYGSRFKIFEDIKRKPLNYGQIIEKTFVLSKHITKNTRKKEVVGILLPNTIANIVTVYAINNCDRIAAQLNYTTGTKSMNFACETAKINVIYTSRQFVEMVNLEEFTKQLCDKNITLIYLEDLKKELSIIDKISGYLQSFAPYYYHKKLSTMDPKSAAVILFTSGSEGTPKGVALSNENILANIAQMKTLVDFCPRDILFNALPMFHCFGLIAGSILPSISGIKTFLYPSPLHYRIVPEIVYEIGATAMFGTNTFLSGYAKYAHPYDFYSIRYIFAGAEKLSAKTRQIWADRFGIRVFEGYGATEASPVISINTPMHNMPGTVGRFLPGIKYKIEPVEGITKGGRLFVSGPNIMKGYLLHDTPGKIIPPKDNWHDTGDIVDINDEGFITIEGRAKRFAKIGGEMVSLTAVELYISEIWPDNNHAVISIRDESKGEKLVLLTDKEEPNQRTIINYAKSRGIAEISIPKTIIYQEKLPLLGSGKVDYNKAMQIVTNS